MKTINFIFFILFFFSLNASKTSHGDINKCELVHVYNGDTFIVNIRDMPAIIGKNIPIKISDIETPSISSKNPAVRTRAMQAKEFLENLLKKSKVITLKNVKRDKYFRILAEVYADDKNVAQELINTGLANQLSDKKKTAWIKTNN